MRFLFCTFAGPGYLNPAIGAAQRLRDRGHSVAFVTDIAAGALLDRAGLQRIPRGQKDGPSFSIERWYLADAVAIQLKHLHHAMTHFQPDVIVGHQMALGALLMAMARKRRFGPFGPPTADRALREKQLSAMLRAGHPLDSARNLLNASSVEAAEQWAAEPDEE